MLYYEQKHISSKSGKEVQKSFVLMFLISISLSNKVHAAVGARHAMEARVTAVLMATTHIFTIVPIVHSAARRVLAF